jgi:hypothetical protein
MIPHHGAWEDDRRPSPDRREPVIVTTIIVGIIAMGQFRHGFFADDMNENNVENLNTRTQISPTGRIFMNINNLLLATDDDSFN